MSAAAASIAVPALQAGSRIRLVAPAGPFNRVEFQRGVDRLKGRYDVVYDDDIFARQAYLAGDDAKRAESLIRALKDDRSDAILAVRGGYGCTRLLPMLSPSLVAAHPKLLIGLSDVTALHALWRRAGVCSVHGHMLGALGRQPEDEFFRWCKHLEGGPIAPLTQLTPLRKGLAKGVLWGGNLAVIAAMLGTPFLPEPEGLVLFLEDIGERPYRIDRMLTSLGQSGYLGKLEGLVIGSFTSCDAGPDGRTAAQVIEERLGQLRVPVLTGLPVGHGSPSLELPLGIPVEVDANAGKVTFDGGAVYN